MKPLSCKVENNMETTLHVNEFNKFRKPKNKKWLICSHSFEKHLWIKISKPWPPRNMGVNENLMSSYYFSKNTRLCLPLPQKSQKAFAHKSKH